MVNFCNDEALEPACLEVTEHGLVLHFNAERFSEMHGETVMLTDIVAVEEIVGVGAIKTARPRYAE